MVRAKPLKFPLVFINIRTFNSEKHIEKTLKSVKRQTYNNIEIVVSDGFSTDRTLEILKKYKVKVNFADKLGDARQQNLENSKGEYVMSVDSDQILSKKLVESCVNKMQKNDLDALTISEKSIISKNSTLLEKLIAYDKWVIDKNKDDDAMFGTACPRFFDRKFLNRVEWPEELSIFDDTILYSEILVKGAKTDYLARPSIYHHEVGSWTVLIKKFFRYGRGYIRAFSQKPKTIAAHSLPRRSYFSSAAFSKPAYFFGLLVLYSVKAVSASMGAMAYLVLGK